MQTKRFVAAVIGAGAFLLGAPGAGASEIEWLKSYDDAKQIAQKRGALMVLDFYADW